MDHKPCQTQRFTSILSSTRHLIISNDNRVSKILVIAMKIKEEPILERSTHVILQI